MALLTNEESRESVVIDRAFSVSHGVSVYNWKDGLIDKYEWDVIFGREVF